MAWTNYFDNGTIITQTSTSATWSSSTATTSADSYIYYHPSKYGTYETVLGTQINFDVIKEKDTGKIHPRLYFKFVKSKMTRLQQKELNERLSKLQKLLVQAEDLGQKALYEELARKVAIAVKEQEINVCGIEYAIHGEIINKYRNKVKGPTIGFCKLESYSRPIPANVKKRIEKCKELKLFDQYWVLYLEYKDKLDVDDTKKSEATEKKTNKEKIKEKDPILFGVQDYMPDKHYFIIDWIDEYCDLTLDKFVETIKKDDPEYDLDKIDDITPEILQKLVKESRERIDRLQKTRRDNYKQLMEEEDNSYKTKKEKYMNEFYLRIKKIKEGATKQIDKIKTQLNNLKKD